MASIVAAASTVIAPASASREAGASLRSSFVAPVSKSCEWSQKTTSNGSKVSCMLVWTPYNNKKFETLSYLPPLDDNSISKEIDYMLGKNWFPCLEFCERGDVYRKFNSSPGYYDGRYWTMWKLPMFGCNDAAAVLREIEECKKAYPNNYIRVLGFDNKRQVQCAGFLVHKPT